MVTTIWEPCTAGSGNNDRTGDQNSGNKMEITILLPCLNEEKTVAVCVRQAAAFLFEKGLDGEVLVSDNGSTDESISLAEAAGARVVHCAQQGYGNALRFGIREAAGKYVILGDCDCSYHFDEIQPFLDELRKGADLVVGNRFALPMEQGAMSLSHRRFGVPILSFLGRIFLKSDVRDFHCGLRAVNRESYMQLNCRYGGMEFATEMIGRASLTGQKIKQVPVKLYRDGRGCPSHLRSIRDGIRHMLVIFTKCRIRSF